MRIDSHVDLRTPATRGPAADRHPAGGTLGRMLRRTRNDHATEAAEDDINARAWQQLAGRVRQSPLDKAVLLALDGVVAADGHPHPELTRLCVANDFVHHAAAQHPELLFGASIHPYRPDAMDRLARCVAQGACLVKWIPSAQRIDPAAPRCFSFYDALAHYGIPLLTHTGVEHTLGMRRSRYNHPRRLIPALERGVTVIAAHCGVHMFLHEPSYFRAWARLARDYENLYGDTGAFAVVTRVPQLRRICRDDVLRNKLVYGSDYPGIPSPLWCWQLGLCEARAAAQQTNPILRNLSVMQGLGMPVSVTERAHDALGIGKVEHCAQTAKRNDHD